MSQLTHSTSARGREGEDFTVARLVEKKFQIVDRNVRERFAEIDIVAKDGETLCFIEVRSRESTLFGHPAETINAQKKRSIRRAAEMYLMKNKIPPCPVRFDVATIVWETMEFLYFENAF